ncbi:anthranilate synthase component II [Candidatus Altiarchaeota archaeon]
MHEQGTGTDKRAGGRKMKVLVIDNIDSFVYNLVQYVGMNGCKPIVLDNRATKEQVKKAAEDVERIIISPGPKRPEDAGISNHVIKEYGKSIPLLGVCLGHQCIGRLFGARIRHARNLMHGKTSMISHKGGSLFEGVGNPFEAVRYHSLVVDDVPDCLSVTARSAGDDEVMGLKHNDYPIHGVQFHPESIKTLDGMKIIKNFLGNGVQG